VFLRVFHAAYIRFIIIRAPAVFNLFTVYFFIFDLNLLKPNFGGILYTGKAKKQFALRAETENRFFVMVFGGTER